MCMIVFFFFNVIGAVAQCPYKWGGGQCFSPHENTYFSCVLACEFYLACFCIRISKLLCTCDECQPLLNYWFLSKRRAACHRDWKFDLIRRVNKKEQLWNIIIYLFVLRINAQTNSCFIEFVKSSYFYTINQPNLCLRCNSPFIILKLYLKLFALVCLEK